MLQQAIEYYNKGYSIIPILPNSKIPALPEWKQYQETRAAIPQLRAWFGGASHNNIGIVCGSISNLVVLDYDPRNDVNGKTFSLVEAWGTNIKTPSGGRHFYFAHKPGVAAHVKDYPGLDIQSDGKYVLAPPSIINGSPYELVSDLLGTLPVWIPTKAEVVKEGSTPPSPAIKIPAGGRRKWLLSRGGGLRRRGYSPETIYPALLEDFEQYCEKKFPGEDLSADILRIACDVGKYAPGDQIKPVDSPPSVGVSLAELLNTQTTQEWLVDRLVPKEALVFVAGLAETNKSWLLMSLALDAACGLPWLGRFNIVNPLRVALLDQERARSETTRRMSMLSKPYVGQANLNENLIILPSSNINTSEEAGQGKLVQLIKQHSLNLVLVDSFVTFHTEDENHRSSIQPVFQWLKKVTREYGCSFVFLDHEGKGILNEGVQNREPNAHDVMGSAAKPQAADGFLTVRRNNKGGSTVYHTKSTCGPRVDPFDIRLQEYEDGAIRVILD